MKLVWINDSELLFNNSEFKSSFSLNVELSKGENAPILFLHEYTKGGWTIRPIANWQVAKECPPLTEIVAKSVATSLLMDYFHRMSKELFELQVLEFGEVVLQYKATQRE